MAQTNEPGSTSGSGLRDLGGYILRDPLRNSVRVLILLSLGMNDRLSFTDLLELTGTSKGSLSHHLEQLETAGLVLTRMVFTLAGPRVAAEITRSGRSVYADLCRLLAELPRNPLPPT